MAEDEKSEQRDNIRKIYDGIQFAKVEDKYDVSIQYDANSDILSLSFTNQNTKSVYKQDFDRASIAKITEKYHLESKLLSNMIIDSLDSKQRTAENLRIYILPNIKQGIIVVYNM